VPPTATPKATVKPTNTPVPPTATPHTVATSTPVPAARKLTPAPEHPVIVSTPPSHIVLTPTAANGR
jgi:hypothetical protein